MTRTGVLQFFIVAKVNFLAGANLNFREALPDCVVGPYGVVNWSRRVSRAPFSVPSSDWYFSIGMSLVCKVFYQSIVRRARPVFCLIQLLSAAVAKNSSWAVVLSYDDVPVFDVVFARAGELSRATFIAWSFTFPDHKRRISCFC